MIETLCAMADEAFTSDQGVSARFPECPPARGGKSAALIEFVRDRPGRGRRYAIDCAKIERELQYWALVTRASGPRSTFDSYVENEWWWRAVMDGSYQRRIATHYR